MSRRRVRNFTSDSKRYYDWLDRAAEDIISAELLMSDDRCYLSSLFHCQQAIEKALKSYLLLRASLLMDGHSLVWLCKQAMKYDRHFEQWLDESAALNRCYIETRYPTDIPFEVIFQQVKSSYIMARDMYVFICEQVDEELDKRERHQQQKPKEKKIDIT